MSIELTPARQEKSTGQLSSLHKLKNLTELCRFSQILKGVLSPRCRVAHHRRPRFVDHDLSTRRFFMMQLHHALPRGTFVLSWNVPELSRSSQALSSRCVALSIWPRWTCTTATNWLVRRPGLPQRRWPSSTLKNATSTLHCNFRWGCLKAPFSFPGTFVNFLVPRKHSRAAGWPRQP